ncbi:hypothetical protein [Mycolicibacterium sp. CBMA 361]|uniref:hypothetical protein n=1 Tax=Mycolicibacterium sp. CBMA 361 TaxID=2606610 RepID=UPI0012DBF026|nr:hypothetical protein [Mycolicibacterium sp. CBMA 361]MUM32312.1 hypothetical protein [Mycolicibacterium sp. CBMA 361]
MNPAAPPFDSLDRRTGKPIGLMGFDAIVHIRQVLPQQVEAFALIQRKVVVSRNIPALREHLSTRGQKSNRLIDVCGDDIDLVLKTVDAVVPVGTRANPHTRPILLDPVELQPVDLIDEYLILRVGSLSGRRH